MYNQNNRKMKKKRLAALALILPVLAACTDDGTGTTPANRTPLSVSAGIRMEAGTEPGTRAVDATWHQGDEIGVYTLVSGTDRVFDAQANYRYTNVEGDGAQASFVPAGPENTASHPTQAPAVYTPP